MNRQPAIAAVPDRRADHGAAAHRVADQVVVQAIAAQHALFAEVAEFGIADRPGGASVVHGVPARFCWIGRFHDDVAAQVGHLAQIKALAEMLELQRLVQRQRGARNNLDRPLFREDLAIVDAGTASAHFVLVALRGRKDDPVAGPPACDRLSQDHRLVSGLGGLAELVPCILPELEAGDLVLTMGAGNIWKVGEELLQKL